MDHIERKMGKFAGSHNTLTDAHNEQDDEMEKLKAKVADMEDRSRRNNVKLRGVPESVLNSQLNQYACDLIRAVLPSILIPEIIIDRIHCLPKPSYLPDDVPHDVIMRVHFYHVKDQLMYNFAKQNNCQSKSMRISPSLRCKRENRF